MSNQVVEKVKTVPGWQFKADWAEKDEAIAAKFGVPARYVRRARGLLATAGGGKAPLAVFRKGAGGASIDAPWAQEADWTARDVDIAAKFGISRERVRQVRKVLGLPKSKFYRERPSTAVHKIDELDTSKLTLDQIARKLSCCKAYAGHLVRRLGKRCVRQDGRRIWKYRWDLVKPEDWRLCRDTAIARILGVRSPGVVAQKRLRLSGELGVSLGKIVRSGPMPDEQRMVLRGQVAAAEARLARRVAKHRRVRRVPQAVG